MEMRGFDGVRTISRTNLSGTDEALLLLLLIPHVPDGPLISGVVFPVLVTVHLGVVLPRAGSRLVWDPRWWKIGIREVYVKT